MARGYFTTPISENLEETPEGFLIARNCVIGRTGSQTYSVRDLPQEAARDMGVDVSNPAAQIDLFRAAEDVFHPDTLRSGEGKSVCDGHPPDFVNPDNFNEYARGHMQNVRRGTGQLESGDEPMVADVLITAEPLLSKVRNKQVRELSLGYDFAIEKRGPRIHQVDIVINHLAVVPKGRAGPEARIQDAAPPDAEASSPGHGAGRAAQGANNNAPQPKQHKEKHRMRNPFLHIWGRGLRAMANDADTDPEDLAQAALDLAKREDDRHMDDRHGRDEEFEIERTGQVSDRRSRDARRGRDLDPEIEVTHTEDRRRRLYDRLDDIMDARDRRATDTDLEELKDLLTQFFSEEEQEPEHAGDDEEEEEIVEVDPAELEEVLEAEDTEAEPGEEVGLSGEENLEAEDGAEEDGDDMECAHCGTAMDGEACPECGCRDGKAKDAKRRAKDRATAHDGAAATLRMIRRAVAQDGGPATRAAFNTALSTLSRTSRARDARANYGGFQAGARDRSRLPNSNVARAADAEAENAKLQEYYDNRRKAGN